MRCIVQFRDTGAELTWYGPMAAAVLPETILRRKAVIRRVPFLPALGDDFTIQPRCFIRILCMTLEAMLVENRLDQPWVAERVRTIDIALEL